MHKKFIPSSHVRYLHEVSPYDLACAPLAPLAALLLRDVDYFSRNEISKALLYISFSTLIAFGCLTYFGLRRVVSRFFSFGDAFRVTKCAAAIVLATLVLMFTFFRLDTIPRSLPILHFFILTTLLCVGRATTRVVKYNQLVAREARDAESQKHIILVGANRLAWFYIRLLESLALGRQAIVGIIDREQRFQGRELSGYPVVGTLATAENLIREYAEHGVAIDRVIVADHNVSPGSEDWQLLERICAGKGIKIDYLPDRLGLWCDTPLVARSENPSIPVAMTPTALSNAGFWRVKRVIDVVISSALLLCFLPVMCAIAAVILVELGAPAIFWQERMGYRTKTFRVYKFRTMLPPHRACRRSDGAEDRLTKLGAFLRRTRLDELPQVVNVLRGEMAFIGPRPLLPVDQPRDTALRLAVRPGITGWAQVQGGKLITPEEKNSLDEWYIRNASLLLDLRILLLSIRATLLGDRRNETAVQLALRERC